MKRTLCLVLSLVLALLLCACENSGADVSGTVNETSGQSNNETQKASDQEKVIYEENEIRIAFLGFEKKKEPLKGYDIKLRIENNSSFDYTIQVRDLSVNNIMTENIFSCDIKAGKTANDSIWVINMEEHSIESPVTIAEFKFCFYKNGDFSDSYLSETITVE